LLEIRRNERCEATSSREWEQVHENKIQNGDCQCVYVELEGVWMRTEECKALV